MLFVCVRFAKVIDFLVNLFFAIQPANKAPPGEGMSGMSGSRFLVDRQVIHLAYVHVWFSDMGCVQPLLRQIPNMKPPNSGTLREDGKFIATKLPTIIIIIPPNIVCRGIIEGRLCPPYVLVAAGP